MYTNQFSFDDERKIEFNEVADVGGRRMVYTLRLCISVRTKGTIKKGTVHLVNNMKTRIHKRKTFGKHVHTYRSPPIIPDFES